MCDFSDYKVLLVDDDSMVLEGLELLLEDKYRTIQATSGQSALEIVQADDRIAVVVMDIKMPGMTGIEAAREIRRCRPDVPVIFHTGFAGQYDESEIDASEEPFGYVQKGGASCQLMREIRNAMDSFVLKKNSAKLSDLAESALGMTGKSSAMRKVYADIRKIAASDNKVMILGETGTGKGLAAEAVHKLSGRRDQMFVKYNCNHTPSDLVESELFGHVKGAFSDAVEDRVGLFEFANGGTVFLDEIGDFKSESQGKILDVIESGEYRPVGWSGEKKKTDVRVICATNRDLEEMVEKGELRSDLYYRIHSKPIVMPPLRDRKEDIPTLVNRFVDDFAGEHQCSPVYFHNSAMSVLLSQDWRGNVRQLQDIVRSAMVFADSQLIIDSDLADLLEDTLPSSYASNGSGLAARTIEFRRNAIIEALHESDGNINAAARTLEMDYGNLRKLIKKYNIPTD